ncbi:hypothetical protein BJP62_16245 [Jeongeupia sp. USM3]|nr:hypothetical protein BJP62_16245 [Jeongeupia sp. USM3]
MLLFAGLHGMPSASAAVSCKAMNLAQAAKCNARYEKARRNWQQQMEGRDTPVATGAALDMKLPDSASLFEHYFGEVPAFVRFDLEAGGQSEPLLFALPLADRALLVIPYRIELGYSTQGRLDFGRSDTRLAVLMLAVTGEHWPAAWPPVLARLTSPMPSNCELGGTPGSEGLASPGSVNALQFKALPERRFLRLETGWMEGYSGGGGRFVHQHLLEVSPASLLAASLDEVRAQQRERGEGALLFRACAPSWYSLSLAGRWNDDGTRQHHEYFAEWRWQVRPPNKKHDSPELQLIELTAPKKRALQAR